MPLNPPAVVVGATDYLGFSPANVFDPYDYRNLKPSKQVCDGTSDQPAVQAALDAASTNGGVVYFSRRGNSVYLSDWSAARTNTFGTWYGFGYYSHTHIRQDPRVTIQSAPWTSGTTAALFLNPTLGTTDFSLVGLRCYGGYDTAQTEDGQWGIGVAGDASNFRIMDNEVWGFRGKGIQVAAANTSHLIQKFWIERNHVHDMSCGNGLCVQDNVADCWVKDNLVIDCLSKGKPGGVGIIPGEAMIIGGSSTAQILRMKLIGNIVYNYANLSTIGLYTDCDISDNYVEMPDLPNITVSAPMGTVNCGYTRCKINRNTLDASACVSASNNVFAFGPGGSFDTDDLEICDNIWIGCSTQVNPAVGISWTSTYTANNVKILRNRLVGTGGIGINGHDVANHVLIEGNLIDAFIQPTNANSTWTVRGNHVNIDPYGSTPGIGATGTPKVYDNIGWKTESGLLSATIASASTSVAVAHGLAATPTVVDIAPTNNPTNDPGNFWWTADGTNITVHVRSDPGVSGATFAIQGFVV